MLGFEMARRRLRSVCSYYEPSCFRSIHFLLNNGKVSVDIVNPIEGITALSQG